MNSKLLSAKPGIFVPTLYFAEGLPYAMANLMSVVMFKNLGADNAAIGVITSFMTVPWVLKPLWSPIIDLVGTRRSWVVVANMVLAVLSGLLAFCSLTPAAIPVATMLFIVVALTSATQDIAIDGFYMDVLDKKDQAFFVGFRQTAYKVAWLTGQGALVMLAGVVAEKMGYGYHTGWCAAFSVCALLFTLVAAFHAAALPRPAQAHAQVNKDDTAAKQLQSQFKQVFATFFSQPSAIAIVAYILTFRLGDALMLKMSVPFLLDKHEAGGLGISTTYEGFIYGTVGTVALLIGGITGSWLVSKFGLRKCLMPAAIFQSAAIPLYWMLAAWHPDLTAVTNSATEHANLLAMWHPDLTTVSAVNAFEQFSYGVGTCAYTVYLMSTVRPEFRASHYAIATGMMALGLMIPGLISGYLTTMLGYPLFFLISFLASIPGIIIILFLPFKDEPEQEGTTTQEAEHGVPQAREVGH